jgi:carbamoylphosphate synthase large subunit
MTVSMSSASATSGQLLEERLRERGYNGKNINWGSTARSGINQPYAIRLASNKRDALLFLATQGFVTPNIWENIEDIEYPAVGRTSYHSRGQGFYIVECKEDAEYALRRGCSHFLELITGAREFRVHVMNGLSIKLIEKIGAGWDGTRLRQGRWVYPQNADKTALREVAKSAVAAMNLDFGAVDMLYKDEQVYILEVNTAPILTENDGTLEAYVDGFMKYYDVQ